MAALVDWCTNSEPGGEKAGGREMCELWVKEHAHDARRPPGNADEGRHDADWHHARTGRKGLWGGEREGRQPHEGHERAGSQAKEGGEYECRVKYPALGAWASRSDKRQADARNLSGPIFFNHALVAPHPDYNRDYRNRTAVTPRKMDGGGENVERMSKSREGTEYGLHEDHSDATRGSARGTEDQQCWRWVRTGYKRAKYLMSEPKARRKIS
ncbi:hypothetical protein K438DRAFT_1764645 [Mycena galopus ATCC 62051]|nr:hypothetical protein K438DRAFT_1764645 [Mycena galopus ATCC 62051]